MEKFSDDLLTTYKGYYLGKDKGKYQPIKHMKNKDVLILGSGGGVKSHKKGLESFVKKYKPFVIIKY